MHIITYTSCTWRDRTRSKLPRLIISKSAFARALVLSDVNDCFAVACWHSAWNMEMYKHQQQFWGADDAHLCYVIIREPTLHVYRITYCIWRAKWCGGGGAGFPWDYHDATVSAVHNVSCHRKVWCARHINTSMQRARVGCDCVHPFFAQFPNWYMYAMRGCGNTTVRMHNGRLLGHHDCTIRFSLCCCVMLCRTSGPISSNGLNFRFWCLNCATTTTMKMMPCGYTRWLRCNY